MGDQLIVPLGAACGVLAVLVALGVVLAAGRRRREHDRLRRWVEQHGWTLTRQPEVDWGRELPGGNKHGVSHCFSTVLHGRPVSVAAYSVTDAGDGTAVNTHHHVVAAATLRRPLPSTTVEPRGAVSRFLGTGRTTTGHPDFDRAFHLRTTTPAALPGWFTPALAAAQLARRVPASWSVRGTELLCHHPGRLEPHAVPAEAAALLPLADLLDGRPPYG